MLCIVTGKIFSFPSKDNTFTHSLSPIIPANRQNVNVQMFPKLSSLFQKCKESAGSSANAENHGKCRGFYSKIAPKTMLPNSVL